MDAISRLLGLGNRLQRHGITMRARAASPDAPPPVSAGDGASGDEEGARDGSGDEPRRRAPWLLQMLMDDGASRRADDQREFMTRLTAAFVQAHGRGAASVTARDAASGTEGLGSPTPASPPAPSPASDPIDVSARLTAYLERRGADDAVVRWLRAALREVYRTHHRR